MKKLLYYVLCLPLFVACNGPRITIIKRHHNKGYYVDVSGRAPKVQAPQGREPSGEPEAERLEPRKAPLIARRTVARKPEATLRMLPPELPGRAVVLTVPRASEQLKPIGEASERVIVQRGDPGYVVWTIIGVLILIWLVSIIIGGSGISGLIHILLAVALILLLLRLIGVLVA